MSVRFLCVVRLKRSACRDACIRGVRRHDDAMAVTLAHTTYPTYFTRVMLVFHPLAPRQVSEHFAVILADMALHVISSWALNYLLAYVQRWRVLAAIHDRPGHVPSSSGSGSTSNKNSSIRICSMSRSSKAVAHASKAGPYLSCNCLWAALHCNQDGPTTTGTIALCAQLCCTAQHSIARHSSAHCIAAMQHSMPCCVSCRQSSLQALSKGSPTCSDGRSGCLVEHFHTSH